MTVAERARAYAGRVYYGWWIVAGSVVTEMLVAGLLLQAYGTYAAVWREQFGWSKTALAGAYALQRAETGLLGPLQGWLLDRFGPRAVMRVGVMLLGGAFLLLARVQTLTGFYLVFVVMALGASLCGILSLMTVIVNWFERKRATALAFMHLGMSLGGLMAPLIAWSIINHGWRATVLASGLLILTVGMPVTGLMHRRPEDRGLLPDGVSASATAAGDAPAAAGTRAGLTAGQAFRTRAFWLLSLGHALAVTLVSAVMVHLVVYLNEGLGYSIQAAAGIFALMTGCSVVGQLSGGWLGDRFDKRLVAFGAMFGHAGGLLALAFASSLAWVLFFALAHGLAWGLRGPQMAALRADYFGRASFARVMGMSSLIVMFGSMSGPVLAGMMADATGSYRAGFLLLVALALLGAGCFAAVRRPGP